MWGLSKERWAPPPGWFCRVDFVSLGPTRDRPPTIVLHGNVVSRHHTRQLYIARMCRRFVKISTMHENALFLRITWSSAASTTCLLRARQVGLSTASVDIIGVVSERPIVVGCRADTCCVELLYAFMKCQRPLDTFNDRILLNEGATT